MAPMHVTTGGRSAPQKRDSDHQRVQPFNLRATTESVPSAALSEIQKLFRRHLHRRGVGHHHRRWSWCRG